MFRQDILESLNKRGGLSKEPRYVYPLTLQYPFFFNEEPL